MQQKSTHHISKRFVALMIRKRIFAICYIFQNALNQVANDNVLQELSFFAENSLASNAVVEIKQLLVFVIFIVSIFVLLLLMGCTQIPISTLSHIWVFVRLYGIVFVIIVIIIIIIMIIKSEGVNAQL